MAILLAAVVISNLLLFFSQIFVATDTITQFQPLADGNTLVSKDGTFELGFFNPGSSTNRYVGIWYKNIPIKTVVWVANRNNPIKDNSSKLIINREGNLVLLSKNQSLLWSTNATTKTSSPIVQLLDTGNLVLRNDNDDDNNNNNENNFLWQSFDHPSNTVLPGMKFGWDLKRGVDRRLTAWKNWDDPSPGDFIWGMSHASYPDIVMSKGQNESYRYGPWNGIRFSGVLGLKPNPFFNYEFVHNENEAYYIYTLKNSSVITIVVLNQTLRVRQRLTWFPQTKTWTLYRALPQDTCDFYNVCGSYGNCVTDGAPYCQCLEGFEPKSPQHWNAMDWTQGCVHSESWSCKVKDKDGFRKFTRMKVPDTTHSWINKSMTLDECRAHCFKNCSCTAYANTDVRGVGSGCAMWFGELIDLSVLEEGQDLYVRMVAPDMDADEHRHRRKLILVVTITIPSVLLMLLAFSYIYTMKTKYKDEVEKHMQTEDLDIPFFDLATIVNATNNFSTDNKLGQGGFGPVYKGTLLDGQEVAVKRLSRSSRQGLKEFKNEVILCSKLQHRHLVKVLGCCVEGEEKMLIYEYMPNKSLDTFLFDPAQSKCLGWSTRFNIMYAIARGLLYLHEDSRLRIIHRDLKVSNILLDNDMNPKISDFGLARMCGGDQIEGNTNRIVGIYGYMAPEYAIHGLFSIKSDVFSFGILLLEIISGKKNRALTYHDHNLIGHAWRLWREGIPEKLIDTCLKDSYILSEALRCIQIGLLCLQHHPNNRPNMMTIVVMLSTENSLPQPKEPSFLIENVSIEEKQLSRRQTTSVNGVTISILNAR